MKVGDIVKLNSGSPPMTVTSVANKMRLLSQEEYIDVSVTWIADDGEVQTSSFPEVCLKPF